MKIIIARTTVETVVDTMVETGSNIDALLRVNKTSGAYGGKKVVDNFLATGSKFKNRSFKAVDQDLVLEINDSLILSFLMVFSKLIGAFAPLLMALDGIMNVTKKDMKKVVKSFFEIEEKKVEKKVEPEAKQESATAKDTIHFTFECNNLEAAMNHLGSFQPASGVCTLTKTGNVLRHSYAHGGNMADTESHSYEFDLNDNTGVYVGAAKDFGYGDILHFFTLKKI